MYLVLLLQNNRATYAKAFNTFDAASNHADELVMMLRGVSDEMPDWEGGEVYEHDGYGSETVVLTGCHEPPDHNTEVTNKWMWKNNKSWANKYDKWSK
jgi:hypothetical protein